MLLAGKIGFVKRKTLWDVYFEFYYTIYRAKKLILEKKLIPEYKYKLTQRKRKPPLGGEQI